MSYLPASMPLSEPEKPMSYVRAGPAAIVLNPSKRNVVKAYRRSPLSKEHIYRTASSDSNSSSEGQEKSPTVPPSQSSPHAPARAPTTPSSRPRIPPAKPQSKIRSSFSRRVSLRKVSRTTTKTLATSPRVPSEALRKLSALRKRQWTPTSKPRALKRPENICLGRGTPMMTPKALWSPARTYTFPPALRTFRVPTQKGLPMTAAKTPADVLKLHRRALHIELHPRRSKGRQHCTLRTADVLTEENELKWAVQAMSIDDHDHDEIMAAIRGTCYNNNSVAEDAKDTHGEVVPCVTGVDGRGGCAGGANKDLASPSVAIVFPPLLALPQVLGEVEFELLEPLGEILYLPFEAKEAFPVSMNGTNVCNPFGDLVPWYDSLLLGPADRKVENFLRTPPSIPWYESMLFCRD
ncbi:hypothetical protein C8Q78DRAFT_1081843 [Trametes maxima]|nr:hypothetical protein C8Q78DRAFT_1081843 [Trametes maxima]